MWWKRIEGIARYICRLNTLNLTVPHVKLTSSCFPLWFAPSDFVCPQSLWTACSSTTVGVDRRKTWPDLRKLQPSWPEIVVLNIDQPYKSRKHFVHNVFEGKITTSETAHSLLVCLNQFVFIITWQPVSFARVSKIRTASVRYLSMIEDALSVRSSNIHAPRVPSTSGRRREL